MYALQCTKEYFYALEMVTKKDKGKKKFAIVTLTSCRPPFNVQ